MSSGRKQGYATRLIEAENWDKIASIAREYSESGVFHNLEKIAEEHGCKVKDVSKLIAYAIVHCLISYAAALRCMNKAHDNQSHHTGTDSRSVSDSYYEKLFRERYDYVLYSFPDTKAARVFDYYIRHPYICNVYKDVGLSRIEMNIVLSRAIMLGIASDEDVEKFKAIALSQGKRTRSTSSFLDTICSFRENICSRIPEEIILTNAQIDSFGSYHTPDEEEDYSYEDLQKKLKDLDEELEQTEREAIEFLETRLGYEEPNS